MDRGFGSLLHSLAILFPLIAVQSSNGQLESGAHVKTEVFLSPKIELGPGQVSNKYYYGADFPTGHIGIKSFDAEVIDEEGNPVPLHETYLHHWVFARYYQRKGTVGIPHNHGDFGFHQSDHITVHNSGVCGRVLSQYFGLGSETRKTSTHVPDPYAIETGNPADIPDGYEEKWMLNVHAIDTRGAEDKLGCTECRCDLYNATADEYGRALPSSYKGGLGCCIDESRCRVKDGFQDVKRSIYLRYVVKYINWDASVVPVKIYILDVTDRWTKGDESRGIEARHHCLIEYNVEACPASTASENGCTDSQTLAVPFPSSGDVIYAVAHQHAGGTGTALYGEGGTEICSSKPIYGTGQEAGDEAGYIVGMTTCYPSPGSIKISSGEMLTIVSNYSSTQSHTGVMSLVYLLVADRPAQPSTLLHAPAAEGNRTMTASRVPWSSTVIVAAFVAVIVFMARKKSRRGEEYEAIIP